MGPMTHRCPRSPEDRAGVELDFPTRAANGPPPRSPLPASGRGACSGGGRRGMLRVIDLLERWAVVVVLAASMLASGCARVGRPKVRVGEDPLDSTHHVRFDSADPATRSIVPLPPAAYHARGFFLSGRDQLRPLPPAPRIDPILLRQVRTLP